MPSEFGSVQEKKAIIPQGLDNIKDDKKNVKEKEKDSSPKNVVIDKQPVTPANILVDKSEAKLGANKNDDKKPIGSETGGELAGILAKITPAVTEAVAKAVKFFTPAETKAATTGEGVTKLAPNQVAAVQGQTVAQEVKAKDPTVIVQSQTGQGTENKAPVNLAVVNPTANIIQENTGAKGPKVDKPADKNTSDGFQKQITDNLTRPDKIVADQGNIVRAQATNPLPQ